MPLPQLKGYEQYRGARLLIWLHSQPIGEVDLSFTSEPLSTDRLASMLWPLIADAVVAHCDDDGIPAPAVLPPSGLVLAAAAMSYSRRAPRMKYRSR